MPGRFEDFVNNGIYHIFNKTIYEQHIFDSDIYCSKFMQIVKYYRSDKANVSFSNIKNYDLEYQKNLYKKILIKSYFNVEVLVFSLMPTHFHFMLQQKKNKGISIFMADVLNSFTRFFNIKNEKLGPLFIPRFKSRKISTDEEAKHVSRYIHLNHFSAGLIKSIDELIKYPWTSLPEYLMNKKGVCNTKFILDLFDGNKERYKKFIEDNADYQKSLELIKHTRNF